MKPPAVVKSQLFWPSVAFAVLIVLPLYAALVVVAIRTKLLDVHGGAFTDEQYKTIWAFLGVALGTAATVMGAILTKSSSNKSLAQQQESERRQKLDTAVQVLNLIKQDDKYAPKAVTAGALAALVHLGHPTIAMRATEVAIGDKAVAIKTAVWLIDQALRADVSDSTKEANLMSKQEAVWLLNSIASELTEGSSGDFQFPTSAISGWPKGLLKSTHYWLLDTMISLLVSQDANWWKSGGASWTWILFSIDELVKEESVDPLTRQTAATYGLRLLTVIGDDLIDGLSDSRNPVDVDQRLRPHAASDGSYLPQWAAVCDWCDATAALAGSASDLDGAAAQP